MIVPWRVPFTKNRLDSDRGNFKLKFGKSQIFAGFFWGKCLGAVVTQGKMSFSLSPTIDWYGDGG